MKQRFQRLGYLVGNEGLERLSQKHVAVFGVGGVGSFVAEALARAGVGEMTIIDYDIIDITNINRQIHALETTVGQVKVEAMAERMKAINPDLIVHTINDVYLPEKSEQFFKASYDYVVDAVDMVTAKIDLVLKCQEKGIPLIASMGTGNKMDPSQLRIADIYETSICPLARVMRRELKKRGVESLKVVYSVEPAMTPQYPEEPLTAPKIGRKMSPGSTSFVPSSAGLMLASVVINDFLKEGESF